MTGSPLMGSLGVLVAVMAALALLETVVPFRSRSSAPGGRVRGNLGLTATTLTLNFLLGVISALGSDALRTAGVGPFASTGPAAWVLVVAVLVLDFSTYAAHRLMHAWPTLWRVHRVHHADPFVDVTTALRQHPLETLLRFTFILGPAWALGLPVESVATYRLLSALNALMEHANLRLGDAADRILSLVVVTPNLHKVHHSRTQPETDSNYGNILAVFDRMFRTLRRPPVGAVEYGLDGYDSRESQRFGSLMRLPLTDL
jgi:sterol desaturase/sphingolipid hydroxylase (fatty acid hydroxylase superfamily)